MEPIPRCRKKQRRVLRYRRDEKASPSTIPRSIFVTQRRRQKASRSKRRGTPIRHPSDNAQPRRRSEVRGLKTRLLVPSQRQSPEKRRRHVVGMSFKPRCESHELSVGETLFTLDDESACGHKTSHDRRGRRTE